MSNTDISIPAILDRTKSVPIILTFVDGAIKDLNEARTAAQILDGLDKSALAYDAAKRAARLQKAKGVHDETMAGLHRAQAKLLDAEAAAKRRLADEYDAAQERGEVATRQNNPGSQGHVPQQNMPPTTAADLGLSRKQIHEARMIRDAEKASPGVVKAAVDEAVATGEEPTRAKVRRAVLRTVKPDAVPARPTRGKAAVCRQVREAVVALTGLPPPEQVLSYFAGTDEAVLVNERLAEAADWLAAFADLWPEDANAEAAE